jgi:hypothetical protein
MAHFAELDDDDRVIRVIVVNNKDILDIDGNESEQIGINFCQNLLGGRWIQTSYNRTFRKNYAGTGYTYDGRLDAFIPPKPFNSWILNESTANWESPVSRPTDGQHYLWNENLLSWVTPIY